LFAPFLLLAYATVGTPKEGSMPHKLQANKEEISREASMNEKEIQ